MSGQPDACHPAQAIRLHVTHVSLHAVSLSACTLACLPAMGAVPPPLILTAGMGCDAPAVMGPSACQPSAVAL
jgi:hypothetical protein